VGLPVIGLIKSKFKDGYVKITGRMSDVEKLVEIGCDLIAVDGTFRKREGLEGPDFINKIKHNFDCGIMADISTHEEGKFCFDAGADCISTTLHGYTPETEKEKTEKPNFELVKRYKNYLPCPVFAEGRISTPNDAKKMLRLGAWGVIVGTAITRPEVITDWFVKEMKRK
ncbi:MAG: putative N-acetylmannosamine-6-phosphate 2-epimerase, partial [Ignavibacteriales bacterium]|nr:putative N-acetylmannosamine-6-phosphate 2-epimerase [Ignavibacteriales bacterium]